MFTFHVEIQSVPSTKALMWRRGVKLHVEIPCRGHVIFWVFCCEIRQSFFFYLNFTFGLAGVAPKLITALLQQVDQNGGRQCCLFATPTPFWRHDRRIVRTVVLPYDYLSVVGLVFTRVHDVAHVAFITRRYRINSVNITRCPHGP